MKTRTVFALLMLVPLAFMVGCPGTGPNGPGLPDYPNNPDDNPTAITFVTAGAEFAPVVTLEGEAEVLWNWSDGTTSTSPEPVKTFGSIMERKHTLKVTPWSAVRRINIGYDGQEGGTLGPEAYVPDQHVVSVSGLSLVAPSLREWCSSFNRIRSLNFSNFVRLELIECNSSQFLREVNLTNTPALTRACFEHCSLESLDLSGSPNLHDIRASVNKYPTITFGDTGASLRHVCLRDNGNLLNRTLFADCSRFPNFSELWIWGNRQIGTLSVPSSSKTGAVSILAHHNFFNAANLSGSLRNPGSLGRVELNDNLLTAIDISGCVQITYLLLHNNLLPTAEVDEVLVELDRFGRRDGVVRLDGTGNAAPSQSGNAAAASLRAKGWTAQLN